MMDGCLRCTILGRTENPVKKPRMSVQNGSMTTSVPKETPSNSWLLFS
jgi:hypothetical protein